MTEQPEPTDLDGIVCRRDPRLKPQTNFIPQPQSEYIDMLTSAMARAKPEIKAIVKRAKSNFGSYAPLDEVIDAITPALSKHGLDLSSQTLVIGDQEWLVSTLSHSSGQFRRASSVIRANPSKPQELLSWTTYLRRNHYACLVGVAADSDLDGAGLEGPKPKSNSSLALARQALVAARSEQERDTVLAKAAMSVVAGRITEDELATLRTDREAMKPFKKEAAGAQ
jgi:hypothetical protein